MARWLLYAADHRLSWAKIKPQLLFSFLAFATTGVLTARTTRLDHQRRSFWTQANELKAKGRPHDSATGAYAWPRERNSRGRFPLHGFPWALAAHLQAD
jgi:hypothetical protein